MLRQNLSPFAKQNFPPCTRELLSNSLHKQSYKIKLCQEQKGIESNPEFKGSTFKPIRGLDAEVVHDQLT